MEVEGFVLCLEGCWYLAGVSQVRMGRITEELLNSRNSRSVVKVVEEWWEGGRFPSKSSCSG